MGGLLIFFIIFHGLIGSVNIFSMLRLLATYLSFITLAPMTLHLIVLNTSGRAILSAVIIVKAIMIVMKRPANGSVEIIKLLKILLIVECSYAFISFLNAQIFGNGSIGLIHILPRMVGYGLRYFLWKLAFEKSKKIEEYFYHEELEAIEAPFNNNL